MYVISGKNFVVKNIAVNDATYTEIASTQKYTAVLIRCRSEVAMLLKRLSTDTEYLTIPSGESLTLAIAMDQDNPFYLKTETDGGEAVAELMFVE